MPSTCTLLWSCRERQHTSGSSLQSDMQVRPVVRVQKQDYRLDDPTEALTVLVMTHPGLSLVRDRPRSCSYELNMNRSTLSSSAHMPPCSTCVLSTYSSWKKMRETSLSGPTWKERLTVNIYSQILLEDSCNTYSRVT